MSRNTEVYRQTLTLLDTLSEGLEYICSLIAEGRAEEALEMMYDTLSGVDSIIKALAQVKDQFPANRLQMLELDMSDKFNRFIDIFKSKDGAFSRDFIVSDLLPVFSEWKREIEKLLMPLILS